MYICLDRIPVYYFQKPKVIHPYMSQLGNPNIQMLTVRASKDRAAIKMVRDQLHFLAFHFTRLLVGGPSGVLDFVLVANAR